MTQELIAKLESASEGSREIDIELMCLLGGARHVGDGVYYGPNEAVWHTSEIAENEGYYMLPSPSRSIDAALALAERVMPGCWANICTLGGKVWVHSKWSSGGGPRWRGDSATPALAICAAILRASAAEGAGE